MRTFESDDNCQNVQISAGEITNIVFYIDWYGDIYEKV